MEKGKISSLEMAMLLYPTVIATAILTIPATIARYAGNDSWLSPILAAIPVMVIMVITVQLHKLYPGKTVIQWSEESLGKIPGKMIGFLIIFFYIQTTGNISKTYSEFIVSSFLYNTPQVVVIVSMIFMCAFCVYGGIEVLARVAQLLFPLFVLPLGLLLIVMAPDFEIKNVLPILGEGMMPVIKGAVVDTGFMAEIFLMAFFLPILADQQKTLKSGMLTIVGVMLTLVIVNLASIFILGDTTATKIYPLMNISRYASFAGFFENMEAVVMAVWIAGAFIKISVFFYAAVLGTAQLLNLSDYKPIVWPAGILVVQLSYWGIPSIMVTIPYESRIFPIYSIIIQIFIPFMLFITAFIWKRKKKRG